MILDKIKNQKGETIPAKEVYFQNGNWFLQEINCHSSSLLGMGTCRCVNHAPFSTFLISRKEVIDILRKNISNISDEEKEDLQKNSFYDRVLEIFSMKGFDLCGINSWLLNCYQLGANPLPALRKMLGCKVEFNYANSSANVPEFAEENTIFVMVDKPDEKINDVWIEIVPSK